MARQPAKGAEFVRYFGPVLNALRALGNSGTPTEVREHVTKEMNLNDAMLNETLVSGQSRFENRVHWARFYLMKAGLIDGSERGVWRLTEQGRLAELTPSEAQELFLRLRLGLKSPSEPLEISKAVAAQDDWSAEDSPILETELDSGHKEALILLLKKMTPKGFEHFCALLLRSAGFTKVNVTGRTNDGGIDGNGYLRINPMMTLRVLFQCKRYTNSAVGKDDIMKFQAAVMRERAEKGLFLATSVFTRGAREEALGGACEIELIDIQRLIELMESMTLGLIEKKSFVINDAFFEEFLTAR